MSETTTSVTKETLRVRLDNLHKQKAQLDTMVKQSTEQALMINGHINETVHWLNTILAAEKAEADAKAAEAAKAQKAAQAKKKAPAKKSPVKVVDSKPSSTEPSAVAA